MAIVTTMKVIAISNKSGAYPFLDHLKESG